MEQHRKKGLGREGRRDPGVSGLEELLVHMGAERAAGSQCPAHKFLGHVPGEGAPCFEALGPHG